MKLNIIINITNTTYIGINGFWIQQVVTMFTFMKDSYDEFTMKAKFLKNFWEDWKIILGKNLVIKKIELYDFIAIYDWAQVKTWKKIITCLQKCRFNFHYSLI
jgi:hypothetical protein